MPEVDLLGTILKHIGTAVAIFLSIYAFVTGRKSVKREKEDTKEIEKLQSRQDPSRRAALQRRSTGMTVGLTAVSMVLVFAIVWIFFIADGYYLGLAKDKIEEGNTKEAAELIEKVEAKNPDLAQAYIDLGDKVLEDDPVTIATLTEALAYYEKAKEIDPTEKVDRKIEETTDMLTQRLDHSDEVLKLFGEFDKAVERGTGFADAGAELAETLVELGHGEYAEKVMKETAEEIVALSDEDPVKLEGESKVLNERLLILRESGYEAEASDLYEAIEKVDTRILTFER